MNQTKLKLYRDIIDAGAIGDAFGYFVEFKSVDSIEGAFQYFSWERMMHIFEKWHISDDTQMTLFALEQVIPYVKEELGSLELLPNDIYNGFSDWYHTQRSHAPKTEQRHKLLDLKELYKCEAPGNTCLSALGSHEMGTIRNPINHSKGCGGIMRTAPIAFIDRLSLEEAFAQGANQAAITHGHPDGYLCAGYFTALLKALIDGETYNQDLRVKLNTILKKYQHHEDLLKYINKVERLIDESKYIERYELNVALGEGWVGDEALGLAMYTAFMNDTFKECLVHASYHNGDSDSTASLAAQLFVAKGGKMGNCVEALDRMPAYPAVEFLFNKLI